MNAHTLAGRAFVGRFAELSALCDALANADTGRGSLVMVGGEAGVGKSRLLAEFRASLATQPVHVALAQCTPAVQRPYGPMLDVMESLVPGRGAMTAAASQRDQFATMAEALVRAADETLTVAILEDVHWADAATLAFLDYLLDHLDGRRILIVASYRPEALQGDGPPAAALAALVRDSRVLRLTVGPLRDEDLRAFITETIGEQRVAGSLRDAVERIGEGNPFFTELLLQTIADARERGEAAATVQLPASVVSAVLERAAPLEPFDRLVLMQAATLGRSFFVSVMLAAFGHDLAALLRSLHRARDAYLVVEDGPVAFRFRHALAREAIYASGAPEVVRGLHGAIAVALEALPDDRVSIEALAHHWSASGNAKQAAHYLEQAGDAAGAVYAHEDAIADYERALDFVSTLSVDAARLLEKIAQRRVISGANDAALSAWLRAADILRELGASEREAECRVRVAQQQYRLGDTNSIAPLETMLGELGWDEQAARNRLHLGIAHISALRYRTGEAASHLAKVDELAIRRDNDLRYSYYATRAMIAYFDGDVERFRAAIEPWLSASYTASDVGLTALVHYNGGMYLSILGAHAEALQHFRSALVVAHERDDRMAESAAHAMSAMALLAVGDLAGVRAAVDAVRVRSTDSQIAIAHAAAWGTLAGLHLDDDALIAEWFDAREASIPAFGAVIYAAGYAEVMVRRGRDDDARALLSRAIDYGDRPRGMYLTLLAVARFGAAEDFERARAGLVLAADGESEVVERHAIALFDAYVAQREGDHARAAEFAAAAIDGFRRLGYPLLEAAALELAGDWDAAREIYRRAAAVRDVRRLTTILSR